MYPSRFISFVALGLSCALQSQLQAADPAPPPTELGEVVVSAPLERTLFEQAQPVSILEGEKLLLNAQPTLGETLARTPGVSSTYFGPAASRPIIRGLDSDRIRVLQNGVNTVDASATSVDHAVSYDPFSATSIEVVRGPATLLYGSNAIGGVVNVIDGRIPDEKIDVPLRGSLGSRYTSVDNGIGADALLEGGIGGFAWHLEGYKRANEDVRIPGFARSERLRDADPLEAGEKEDRDVLPNSNLRTKGFSAGASYIWDGGYFGASYSGFDTNYGTVAEKEVSIDMQQRRWDFAGAFTDPFGPVKSIKYRFGYSDYEHTEFEGAETGTVFKNQGYDGRVEITHQLIGILEGAIGYQTEKSDFSALGEEAFLPEIETLTNSAFVFEEIPVGKVRFQFGARYDHITVDAANDPKFGPARSRTFDNFSGSIGVVWTPVEDYAVALSTTYSERAPTYQELFADGPHVATGVFETGDADLPVEQSVGVDLSLRKRTGRVTGSVSGFYNRFDHFISQFPTGAVGELDGEEFPVYAYRSIDAAFYGAELETTFHLLAPVTAPDLVIASAKSAKEVMPASPMTPALAQTLDLELRADYVHAEDLESGDPLPRIPPFHLSATLDYQRGPFGASLEGIYAGHQARVPERELATDSYFLVNAALTYQVVKGPVTVDFYVKGVNLTDEEAREHTSFLKDIAPLAGRGLVVGMKTTF